MASLPPRAVRLILIDPPYFTGKKKTGTGEGKPAYRDNWRGGRSEYLSWLLERIERMRELLLPDGSLVIQLDWHVVHAAKVALDELFGEDCFQNEIIWFYQTGGSGRVRFSRKHDTLLWYTRSPESWVFHPERIPVHRAPKALERARNPKGARISAEDVFKHPGDVLFVPPLNPMSRERTGYPTQKPLELMELFIEALTEPGEVVADFFCGSGTTLLAAEKHGRKWLGCDLSEEAVRVARERIEGIQAVEETPPLIKRL
ncbi:MAG: Modification methylase RsrI [bacterium]|nr:Modification methylase RsrI [bacterium]